VDANFGQVNAAVVARAGFVSRAIDIAAAWRASTIIVPARAPSAHAFLAAATAVTCSPDGLIAIIVNEVIALVPLSTQASSCRQNPETDLCWSTRAAGL
jgi:hypothetical protein